MEMISKISKGSKMDQIYIPKNRIGLNVGEYVIITLVNKEKEIKKIEKLYFYGIKKIEPVKLKIIEEVFSIIRKINPENIIITGSFLEEGFKFNDIDILVISEKEYSLSKEIKNKTGIETHIIFISNKSLFEGLKKDPMYQMMLSKCISKKRLFYKVKNEPNYRILDLHLLKSKVLFDNYDELNGEEKYYLTRNIICILLFIQNKKISKDSIEKEIKNIFGIKTSDINDNKLKRDFIKKYKEIYNSTFNLILKGLGKNENEQKQAN